MVFDNCQIDVFFHMRNHYNRLRSVHSVVDCSAPKGLRRLNQSSTSLQHAGMAPFCNNTNGIKSHNCKYTNCIPVISPVTKGCSPRAKSLPPRPGTRRHPDDMPLSRDMCSRSAKIPNRHPQECIKTSPVWTGRPNQTTRHRPKTKPHHHTPAMSNVYYATKNGNTDCSKLESFHSKSDQDIRSNTAPTLTSVNQIAASSGEYGEPKEHPKYNTPISTPTNNPTHVSPRDHEYLQFLLKITEDIIHNDLYTNKEMKKVFVSHFNANKDRLNSERMILQIHQLMQELNIPLSGDQEEDSTPSWSEIEAALKALGIEETKQKGDVGTSKSSDSKYKSFPGQQDKCICFDLRNFDQNSLLRRKIPEEEVESTNYDDYASKNKFQTSLDRLTEHTEPISSQATCKASTITSSSTFENVDVLPGFECLETPRPENKATCDKPSQSQCTDKPARKVSYRAPCLRKKPKKRKRRKRSRSTRIKRPKSILKASTCSKCIENVCQASIVAQSRGTDPDIELITTEKRLTENCKKPLIITLQEGNENQTNCNNLFLSNAKNDYLLIKGPIYLLKTFLVENPNLVMRIETPSVPTLVNTKLSESNHLSEPKNDDNATNGNSIPLTSLKGKDEDNTATDGDVTSTSEKYKEIRNILVEMTSNLSMNTSCSSFKSKENSMFYQNFGSTMSTQTDRTGASKFATNSAMHFPSICSRVSCSNPSKCSQFCSALVSKPNQGATDDKLLMTNEYDLTPQRDNEDVDILDMDQLIGEDYNVPSVLHNFLLSREMQTEDLHVEPTIVAFARIHKDEMGGNPAPYSSTPSATTSTEEVTNILNSLGVKPGKSFSQNEPKTSKLRTADKKNSNKLYRDAPTDTDTAKSVTMRESLLVSYPTTSTTSERTSEIPDEVGQEFQMKMMFPFLQNPKLQLEPPKADSDEAIAHTRRVSIMRNPIVQVPIEKSLPDVEDSKKKTESIMKAVDVFKDRQTSKGASHLSKAVQDLENNRESRMVEKMLQESRWTPDQPALKHVPDYQDFDASSIDEVYAVGTEVSSYVDLPIKLSVQRQGETYGSDSIVLEPTELKPSTSQIQRITLVSEKLDSLRNVDKDDDFEISATLDQLVILMKQEQEKEEDIQIKNEGTPEDQSDTSVNRKYFRCCNFGRRKSAVAKKNIQEPPQRDSFSEKQYRSKSEAFEMALIALGQASTPTPEKETAKEKATGSELMEVSSAQSIVLALGGTKLPALKFGGPSEKTNDGISIDFDVISTMALRVDDEKTAKYKF